MSHEVESCDCTRCEYLQEVELFHEDLTFCVRCAKNKAPDDLVEWRDNPVCTDCITTPELIELRLL